MLTTHAVTDTSKTAKVKKGYHSTSHRLTVSANGQLEF